MTLLKMALLDRSKPGSETNGKPQKLEITTEKLTLRSHRCPVGAPVKAGALRLYRGTVRKGPAFSADTKGFSRLRLRFRDYGGIAPDIDCATMSPGLTGHVRRQSGKDF
jgi:hypothetical protein